MITWQHILGCPWPVTKALLEDSGVQYRLIDSYAPHAERTSSWPGLVSRIKQKPDYVEIVLTYPVFEPNSADLPKSGRSGSPGAT